MKYIKEYKEIDWEDWDYEEYDDMNICQMFWKFLKDINAYDCFIENLYNYDNHPLEYKDWNSVDTYCFDIKPDFLISKSFYWSYTYEGWEYWDSIHNEWIKILKKIGKK